MSVDIDTRVAMAVIELEQAVKNFEKATRFPLIGYTVRQPYAGRIRAGINHINSVLEEEFTEILQCLEPDSE